MITQNTNRIRDRLLVWRVLKLLMSLVLLTQAGCFGPWSMKQDIDLYNRNIVDAETDMFVYNIGRLYDHQPPHFMMLSSVSQTRSFSAGGGFQWSQALSALNPMTAIANLVSTTKTVTTTSSALATGSTWQAGPFTAGSVENPTITFVPIQGQEFANRFESPLRDKLTLFLEDQNWYGTVDETKALVLLFAQSLYLQHAPASGPCRRNETGDPTDWSALYVNRRRDPNEPEKRQETDSSPDYFYDDFSDCVYEIVRIPLYEGLIYGHHRVPTKAGADPAAADVVSALGANYEWTEKDKVYSLNNPFTIPGWFDYDPVVVPAEQGEDLKKVKVPFEKPPKPIDLVYGTPKGYTVTQDPKGDFVIVPDGYGLNRAGELKKLGTCESRPDNTCKSGKRETGLCEAGNCDPGKCEADKCEPFECSSLDRSAGRCESDKTRLLYSDKIVDEVWPVQQDYLYVELRRNDPQHPHIWPVYNKTAEDACFGPPDPKKKNHYGIVCGYFKIGNLLEIMQRLASMACPEPDSYRGACSQGSIFGVGREVPVWADRKAYIGAGRYIWEPAHDPHGDPKSREMAKIDREMFSTLYKLYQLSLVDTSKLVAGAPPVTISK